MHLKDIFNPPKRLVLLIIFFSMPAVIRLLASALSEVPVLGLVLMFTSIFTFIIYVPAEIIATSICCGDYTSPEIFTPLIIISIIIYSLLVNFIINLINSRSKS